MMVNLTKSILSAVLGLMLLAAPVAFSQGCVVSACCCHPEKTVDLTMGGSPCCGCGIAQDKPVPFQTAVNLTVLQEDNIRPDVNYIYPEHLMIQEDLILDGRIFKLGSLSPPSIEKQSSSPLLC